MSTHDLESKMLQSISEELGIPNLLEVLSDAPMGRLKPLLINAFKNRVARKLPIDLLKEYEARQEFFGICSIPQDEIYKFASACFDAIPEKFSRVQASPITPLGLNSVLSKVSQNNSLASIRGSEVVSDITSQLALECALRRKRMQSKVRLQDAGTVDLCSFGRSLRLQPFDKGRGYTQHFELFGLCSCGRQSLAHDGLVVPTLLEHIAILLGIVEVLKKIGYEFCDVSVNISDTTFLEDLIVACKIPREDMVRNSLNDDFDFLMKYGIDFPREVVDLKSLNAEVFKGVGLKDRTKYYEWIGKKILEPLRANHPGVKCCIDFTRKSGLGYYPQLCFHIYAKNSSGEVVQLADGGSVDWSSKLLSDCRETMVISGIGSELVQKHFRVKR